MLKISMHRGDYIKRKINIVDSSGNVIEDEFDEIYITFKKSANIRKFLFQKKLSSGNIIKNDDNSYNFEILPEDTDSLDFGTYAFDIELYRQSPLLKQTILGQLVILEEVTHAINE